MISREDAGAALSSPSPGPAAAALARAAGAVGRLDQALAGHPLAGAWLYRARLDAMRRHAAVDGYLIDVWQLAAVIEGLRLRVAPGLTLMDRGAIFEAVRHAFDGYQWLTRPDFDQEGEIRKAHDALVTADPSSIPLVAAGNALHAWLDAGGSRAAMRAALVRFWRGSALLRLPAPLTGAAALRPEVPWEPDAWLPVFLAAIADEAEDGLQLLASLERAWLQARRAIAGRRRNSSAGAAVDVLAAAPLVSASSLAVGLDIAVKNAAQLLGEFASAGIVVEVSHRAKRRLYGLAALVPLSERTVPPRRPQPGRGRGRPPIVPVAAGEPPESEPAPLSQPIGALSAVERHTIDYSDLDRWMIEADMAIHHAKSVLERYGRQGLTPAVLDDE